MSSYLECSARQRVQALFDAHSFHEWLPPAQRLSSPHLAQLGVPSSFDDGVAIGQALLDGQTVYIAAQEGEFMGGGVGEVHGAKLVGLLRRAMIDRPAGVILLLESGGVRLHEANAGLIAVSEVMRALLDTRNADVPVIALVGGQNGCFGGMGIVARCTNHLIMSDVGRLAMSGPEVIEASHGVEEYDSQDRALVWQTSGGKHRWLTADCDDLVSDTVAAFRAAALRGLKRPARGPVTLEELEQEHRLLAQRAALLPVEQWEQTDNQAQTLWQALGVKQTDQVGQMDATAVKALRSQEVLS
ncbi:biotin-independent malonate decarboxylase subunit beta [Alcaligenes pakistanensis]|uniref:Biotin-independent malonate decarboxylase subunit beta n=1 Tax=Alcaligenes pakistanensis TaxID=1482717 RepID=A0A8H9IJT8_9BURK|nr:biotin-independent malonate decarboxylase subunit beta [Alcaligenes pakistanensis]MBP6621303.1 biotin-independent malonate decarboxylase subunit beta [Alcaligenes sp.]GHC45722.1 biotin-independent malonate decarboxylase subunit beta [Alcaligenes pakistanensis]HCA16360.1 biotin-independent malonate decarboxylase subunit beta [Alcaligenes faecalis]